MRHTERVETQLICCPVCNSERARKMGVVEQNMGLTMYRCRNCDLVYAYPKPTLEELAAFYTQGLSRWSDEQSYIHRREAYFNFYGSLISYLMKEDRKYSLLDVGCGVGFLGSYLSEFLPLNTTGIDISPEDCQKAESRLDSVICGDICDPTITERFGGKLFDFVTMTDVIEHLPDPRTAMNNILKVMNSDGYILIDTGNIGGFGSRLAGVRTPFLHDAGHIIGYSQKSITYLLETVGFKIHSVHSEKEVFARTGEKIPWTTKVKRVFTSSPNMIIIAKKNL